MKVEYIAIDNNNLIYNIKSKFVTNFKTGSKTYK